MPRLGVVFDTNVYVALGPDNFTAVRRDEGHHSIMAYANHIVASELLAGLVDDSGSPSDREFGRRLAALRRLAEHCRQYNGSRSFIRVLQLPRVQRARALFGTAGQATADAISDLILEITGAEDSAVRDVVANRSTLTFTRRESSRS